jgi:hypothetical protein
MLKQKLSLEEQLAKEEAQSVTNPSTGLSSTHQRKTATFTFGKPELLNDFSSSYALNDYCGQFFNIPKELEKWRAPELTNSGVMLRSSTLDLISIANQELKTGKTSKKICIGMSNFLYDILSNP